MDTTPTSTIPDATPCNLSYEAIEQYADRIAKAHNLYADGPADINRLLESLGGKIDYADGEESLHIEKPGEFTIKIPYFTSSLRDRFTIAHELGHYFLHYRLPGVNKKVEGKISFGRGKRNKAETEANVFASCLLMPKKEFTNIWKERNGDEWAVSTYFNVSPAAAKVRASVLNIL